MITASQVKELREKTGAGMMECKKVLTETDGDIEKAMELLRERGITKAAKKASRVAAEGLVGSFISEDGKVGAIAEVNAETDFVAENAEFKQFVNDVVKQVALNNPADVEALLEEKFIADPEKTVKEALKAQKENEAENKYIDELFEALLKETTVDVPHQLIHEEIDEMVKMVDMFCSNIESCKQNLNKYLRNFCAKIILISFKEKTK